MAHSYIVNKARGGTVGKPGPPIILNLDGARAFVYEVEESDASPTDEFELVCVPAAGIVSLYEAKATDCPAGTTIQTEVGTVPGFTADTGFVAIAASAGRVLREENWAVYSSPSDRLVFRSGASSHGCTINHRLVITEGHGYAAGSVSLLDSGGEPIDSDSPLPVALHDSDTDTNQRERLQEIACTLVDLRDIGREMLLHWREMTNDNFEGDA